MDYCYIILAILVASAVKCDAECDVSALAACGQHMAGFSGGDGSPQDQAAMCNSITQLQTCLAPFEAECSTDTTYTSFKQAASAAAPACAGAGTGTGTGGGMCDAMQCMMAMIPDNAGGQPEPEPDMTKIDPSQITAMCTKYDTFKTCLEGKDVDACGDQIKASINAAKTNYMKMCDGECAAKNAMKCISGIDVSVFENLQGGLPSVATLEPLCKLSTNMMDCITKYLDKCPNQGDQDQRKNLNMYKKVLNVFCKDNFQALVKHQECVENTTVNQEMTKCIKVPLDSEGKPKAESREEMCSRIEKEQMCMDTGLEKYCGAEAKKDLSNMYFESMQAFGGEEGGCTSGADSTFKLGIWVSMLFAGIIMAFFL